MNKACARCEKSVYPTEELKCLDKVWHKTCFKCQTCGMALNMKTYKGYNKFPYCEAHIPKAKATTVVETPEMRRLAENTKLQSQVQYHADFEKAKGKFTQVADDPEMLRIKANSKIISNVLYHGELEKKAAMEQKRTVGDEASADNAPPEKPYPVAEPVHQKSVAEARTAPVQVHHHHQQQQQHQHHSQQHHQPPAVQQQPEYRYGQPQYPQPPPAQHSAQIHHSQPVAQPQHHAPPQYAQQRNVHHEPPSANYQRQHAPSHQQGYSSQTTRQYQTSSYEQNANYLMEQQRQYKPQQQQQTAHVKAPYQQAAQQYPQYQQQQQVQQQLQQQQLQQQQLQQQQLQQQQLQQQHQQLQQQLQQQQQQQQQHKQESTYYSSSHHGVSSGYHQPSHQAQRAGGRSFRAMYDYDADEDDEVSFRDGDVIVDCKAIDDGWMVGTVLRSGRTGMVPANYLEPMN